MAKAKVNRSQAIREYLTANPDSKASEVVSALKANGVTVNDGLVYAVKGGMAERKHRKHRVAKAAMAAHSADSQVGTKADAITMIREVKALAAKAGGYKKLMELVVAMAE
jgi:hypothetical protein